jgi:hypothetical protein
MRVDLSRGSTVGLISFFLGFDVFGRRLLIIAGTSGVVDIVVVDAGGVLGVEVVGVVEEFFDSVGLSVPFVKGKEVVVMFVEAVDDFFNVDLWR